MDRSKLLLVGVFALGAAIGLSQGIREMPEQLISHLTLETISPPALFGLIGGAIIGVLARDEEKGFKGYLFILGGALGIAVPQLLQQPNFSIGTPISLVGIFFLSVALGLLLALLFPRKRNT